MPGAPDDRRLILALSLLAVLLVAQAGAFARQWVAGYRPFGAPPVRVPLSWDMFSTHIERCDIVWEPPLPGREGPAIDRLSRTSRPFEWFTVRATRAGYRDLAALGCQRATQPTRTQLLCWLPDGTRTREETRCR